MAAATAKLPPSKKVPRSNRYLELRSQFSEPEDEAALALIPKLNMYNRVHVLISVFQQIEGQLMSLGWRKCTGEAKLSDGAPFGFVLFDRSRVCFNSPVQNSMLWLAEFTQSDLDTQSLFFASVDRLRRNLTELQSETLPQ